MKKLLITSMAAVAVSICAKATETYTYNTTESFESYNEGPLFQRQAENEEAYVVADGWDTTATPEDGIFTVTNIANYVGAGTHETVSRPITVTPNAKALAIDTSKPLMRTVHTDPGSSDALTEEVFFDSVVQFTATDAKPTPGEGDKLMVWLYKSEDVSDDNKGAFGESIPTNALVVTALNNEDEMEHFLTDMVIEPDSWHRLTIKSFRDSSENVLFNIWVDTTKVGGDFVSLLNSDDDARNLTGVAFDGKGAVDDLVFTTVAPEFAGGGEEPEPQKYYTLNIVGDYFTCQVYGDEYWSDNVDTTRIEVEKKTLWLEIKPVEDYELESIKLGDTSVTPLPDYSESDKSYALDALEISNGDIEDGAVFTLTIQMKKKPSSGGDVTVGDTTVVIGDDGKITNITTAFNGQTVSGNLDTSKFKAYYVVSVDNGVLSIKLDQKVAAPFAEATDLDEGEEVLELDETDTNGDPIVGVSIKTFKGLYYGLSTAAELGSDWTPPAADAWKVSTGDGTIIKLTAPKQGDTRFYKIEVKDINPNPAQ